jgi:hypothetical protein
MNDSYEVAFTDACLCCSRLYMRKFTDMETAKEAVGEREACPTCAHVVTEVLRECTHSALHLPVNRLWEDQ